MAQLLSASDIRKRSKVTSVIFKRNGMIEGAAKPTGPELQHRIEEARKRLLAKQA